jgi:serine phosphatase RsbU (regulator of sigma subunit)
MSTDWSDIGDEEWADRLKESIEQARFASTGRMQLTQDLLESEQRIDEMEAEVEGIDDPVARGRQHAAVLQARMNNKLGETDHYLLEQIVQLQEAVVLLADRVRALQVEARDR